MLSGDDEGLPLPAALQVLDPELFPSASRARKYCRKRRVSVNGAEASCSVRVRPGDSVEWREKKPRVLNPDDLPVLLEDDHLAVVRKPRGMIMHGKDRGEPGQRQGTDSYALSLAAGLPLVLRPSAAAGALPSAVAVHRLDLKVEGLVVCAKTERAQACLHAAFQARRVRKTYQAIVLGDPGAERGVVERPLEELCGARRLQSAVTEWEVTARSAIESRRQGVRPLSLLRLRPETGRTHQLRRHCAEALGCPIVGDMRYGGPLLWFKRLFLCATELAFEHPTTGEPLHIVTDAPPAFGELLSPA